MRTRLLAGAAAAVAMLALTACRSSPNVAAYVGDNVITEQQVTELTDGWNSDPRGANNKVTREIVVEYVLGDQLCDRAAKAKGFKYEAPPVPAGSPAFFAIASRYETCRDEIPVTPATEAEMRSLYEREIAEGRLSPDVRFEDVRGAMETNQSMQRFLSSRRALDEQAAAADVVINPRYGDPFASEDIRTVVNRPVEPQQPQQPPQPPQQ